MKHTLMKEPLGALTQILQLAYSGELAAAFAYQGHWHSVRDLPTRDRIKQIELEEWHHRKLVGGMLQEIGRKPNFLREIKAFLVGRVLGFLCHVSGWFLPMYAAGKLERRNIQEYEIAARYALQSGYTQFVDCLLTMAEVEWEHEKYFRSCVLTHRLSSHVPLWTAPPPKDQIRITFQEAASKLVAS